MMGRTHTVLGTLAAVGVTQATNWPAEQEAAMLAATFLTSGSVKMRLGRRRTLRLPNLSPDCDIWLKKMGLPIEHRRETHRPPICAAVAAVVGIVVMVLGTHAYALPIAAGVAIGWLSHTLLDSPTLDGSPLLWPFYREKVHTLPRPLRFRVGHVQPVWCALLLGAAAILAAVVYVGA